MRNKSERTKAKLKNEPIPDVKGINHKRSEAYNLREAARSEQRAFNEQEARWWELCRAGKMEWHEATNDRYNAWKDKLDAQWTKAEETSFASGFEFYDRNGKHQRGKERSPPFIVEAVDIYLANSNGNWKTIKK